MTSSPAYWNKVGGEWELIGPPLRPCQEDIGIMERLVSRWKRSEQTIAPQAVLLGVTPEIAGMTWPEKTHLLAFDREPSMIRNLWQHRRVSTAAALCSSWFTLPLVDGYADMVLGDGSLSFMAFPGEYRQLAQELARVLGDGGLVVMRVYAAPADREFVEDVFRSLWAGEIENFNTFKWRLAMALIDPDDYSVSVNDVWGAWHDNIGSAERLSKALGWPLPVIQMIERYKGCVSTRYTFPQVEHIREAFSPFFHFDEMIVPSYQDGERYPTICFRKI